MIQKRIVLNVNKTVAHAAEMEIVILVKHVPLVNKTVEHVQSYAVTERVKVKKLVRIVQKTVEHVQELCGQRNCCTRT